MHVPKRVSGGRGRRRQVGDGLHQHVVGLEDEDEAGRAGGRAAQSDVERRAAVRGGAACVRAAGHGRCVRHGAAPGGDLLEQARRLEEDLD